MLVILFGIFVGCITGLIPGIHINLISTLIVSLSPTLLQYVSILDLVVFIISMSTTHSFVDSIPSIFLGAPDSAYAASVLPGHRMLCKGQGYGAVYFTVVGSFFALIICSFLIAPLIQIIPWLVQVTKNYLGYLLITIIFGLIMLSKKYFKSLLAFILSGILGFLVLNSNLQNPLLPLLSGLFGISLLLVSLFETSSLPEQTNHVSKINQKERITSITAGTVAGVLTAIFPGLGSAQGAVLALTFFKDISSQGFLILTGALNTVNFVISLITFYTIDKARNGSVVAIKTLIDSITFYDLSYLFLSAIVTGAICVFVTLFLAKKASLLMNHLPYKKVVIGVIFLIIIVTLILSKWQGLFVLLLSTCIGLVISDLGVPKHFGMGCLLLPTIFYFL